MRRAKNMIWIAKGLGILFRRVLTDKGIPANQRILLVICLMAIAIDVYVAVLSHHRVEPHLNGSVVNASRKLGWLH